MIWSWYDPWKLIVSQWYPHVSLTALLPFDIIIQWTLTFDLKKSLSSVQSLANRVSWSASLSDIQCLSSFGVLLLLSAFSLIASWDFEDWRSRAIFLNACNIFEWKLLQAVLHYRRLDWITIPCNQFPIQTKVVSVHSQHNALQDWDFMASYQ